MMHSCLSQPGQRKSLTKALFLVVSLEQSKKSMGAPIAYWYINYFFKKIKAALWAELMKTHFLWMRVLRSNSLVSNNCQFPLQLFPRSGTPLSHVDSLMSNKGCAFTAAFLSMGPLIRSLSSIKTACFHKTQRNVMSLRLNIPFTLGFRWNWQMGSKLIREDIYTHGRNISIFLSKQIRINITICRSMERLQKYLGTLHVQLCWLKHNELWFFIPNLHRCAPSRSYMLDTETPNSISRAFFSSSLKHNLQICFKNTSGDRLRSMFFAGELLKHVLLRDWF